MNLACPSCLSPVPHGSFSCPLCKLAVRLEGDKLAAVYPAILPSAPIFAADMRTQTFPWLDPAKHSTENVKLAQTREGFSIDVAATRSFDVLLPFMRLRDACFSLRLAHATESARVTLLVRSEALGKSRKQYGFVVFAARREAKLVRLLGGPKATYTVLGAGSGVNAFPLGPGSVLELRAQGPMLEGLVDGRRVAVVHDPVLGIGSAGFRVEGEAARASAVIAGVQLCGVVA